MTKEERDIIIKEHRWQREKEVLERKYKLKQEKRDFKKCILQIAKADLEISKAREKKTKND